MHRDMRSSPFYIRRRLTYCWIQKGPCFSNVAYLAHLANSRGIVARLEGGVGQVGSWWRRWQCFSLSALLAIGGDAGNGGELVAIGGNIISILVENVS